MSIQSIRLRIENIQREVDSETDRVKKSKLYKRLITLQGELIELHMEEARKLSAEVDPNEYDSQKSVESQLMKMRTIKFDYFLLAALFLLITLSCLFVAIETGTKSFTFATIGSGIATVTFIIYGVRENKKSA